MTPTGLWRWRVGLGLGSLVVALATGLSAFALSGGASSCSSGTSCFLGGADLLDTLHVALAGLLLLLLLALWGLTVPERRADPRAFGWATSALLVLVTMAAIGSAFVSGSGSAELLLVQTGLLAVLLCLLAALLRHHLAARPRTGEPSSPTSS